jgi:hypothetical protein
MLRSEETPWQSVVVFFARGLSLVACYLKLSNNVTESIAPGTNSFS